MTRLALSLLGPMQVTLEGEPTSGFRSDKERALLAYLAVEADRPHRRGSLIGLLWADQPEAAALGNLRQALFRLRQALRDEQASPPSLLVTPKTVQFNLSAGCRLDVAEFEARLAATRTHRHRHAETCRTCQGWLEEAARLYRGGFLQGFFLPDSTAFEEWAAVKREQVRRQALDALGRLAEMCERRGDHAGAQQHAQRQVELEPWREAAHRQLMRALAASGQRAAALAQYEASRRVLADELGVEPEAQTTALYEEIRSGATLHAARSTLHNLPRQTTPFIGRQAELGLLRERLLGPDYHLITLVGEGGVGKSRLALAAAEQVGEDFLHGAWWVPLAGVAGADLTPRPLSQQGKGDSTSLPRVSEGPGESVPPPRVGEAPAEGLHNILATAIAAALRFSFTGASAPAAQLLDYLRDKELLLMLDNFEHLLAGADFVLKGLQAAPRVVFLITSREPLNFQAEWLMRLGGLPVPPRPDTLGVLAYDGLRLFAERAERAAGKFAWGAGDVPAIVQVCQSVEGLPLAIELAAARTKHMPAAEIAGAIRQNLDFLATTMGDVPLRHRSLRAVFEWSWQWLPAPQRSILAQASVFRGGFSLHAAGAVTGAAPADLAALADRSLLRQAASGRFEMHELLRQFAAEKLSEAEGGRRKAEDSHGTFYLDFVQRREAPISGRQPQTALAEIQLDLDNIRQAWRWAAGQARTDDLERGLGGLSRFYEVTGLYHEAADAFGLAAQLLAALAQSAGPPEMRLGVERTLCRLLFKQARAIYFMGNYEQAIALARQCTDLAHSLGRAETESGGYLIWGGSLMQQQDAAAGTRLQQALELARAAGSLPAEADALSFYAYLIALQGDLAGAQAHFERAVHLCHEIGDATFEGAILANLINLAREQGDITRALAYAQQSLQLSRQTGSRMLEAIMLPEVGAFAAWLGDLDGAQEYLEQALALSREIGLRETEIVALNALSQVFHRRGGPEAALHFSRQALRVAQDINNLHRQATALKNLGHAFEGLKSLGEAADAYQQALNLHRDLDLHHSAMESLAGLARVALARGETAQALTYVEEILTYLESGSLVGADEPFHVHLTSFRVLQANHDARAPAILQTAHELLQARAATIGDEATRRSFLESVPAHREIRAEHASRITP